MKPTHLSQALELLTAKRRSAFIWGPPGIGKSDIVRQLGAKMGYQVKDARLALMDPVDVKGFPVPDHETKQMHWFSPDFLPPMTVKKGTKMVPNPTKGILFLDEFNTAERATQAAAYQLLLDYRIGEYELPEGWSIVAAGNRMGDRAIVNNMSSANASRLVHLDLDVSLEDWSAWALKNGVKPEILAYLRTDVTKLHDFHPDKVNTEGNRTFPCPRTWMFVNQIIGEGLKKDIEFDVIKGTIGEGVAGSFYAYLQNFRDIPSMDQIRMNPKGTKVPEDNPSAMYAVTTAMAAYVTPDSFEALMQYNDRLPAEYQVVFIRDAVRRTEALADHKEFTKWSINHADVLL